MDCLIVLIFNVQFFPMQFSVVYYFYLFSSFRLSFSLPFPQLAKARAAKAIFLLQYNFSLLREANLMLFLYQADFGHFVNGLLQHSSAPEVLMGHPYDEKCDMWAVGVIAYIL